ncbi:MAG: glycosyltransferase family 4 protein [Acidaminococcaceae bacterium]
MKLLFLGDAGSIHIKKWVDFFVNEGIDVYVATFASENKTQCANVFYLDKRDISTSGNNYHYLLSVQKLSNIIRDNNITHINAHYAYSMGVIAAIAIILSGKNINFSVVCHGSDILLPPHFFSKYINKFVLNKAHTIFAVSKQIAQKVVELGINKEKIFVGQYGVDEQCFIKEVIKDIDIISYRAYVSNSQWGQILKAVDCEEFRNKKIIFVMPGIDETNLAVLEKKFPEISFYRWLPRVKLLSLVQRSKLYISATQSDGSSLSLLEAMALRCYPIVSNISANKEWITDGENGTLFINEEELRNALVKILQEDNHCIALITDRNQKEIKRLASYNIQMRKIKAILLGEGQDETNNYRWS